MTVVDLFSGCGGMSLGFERAGFTIKAAFDNWDKAIEIYKKNFGHPIYNVDLTKDTEVSKSIQEIAPDILIGGPPCQDFSSAGKRDISLGRADLTYHFANIVSLVKPKLLVMENVERIKKSHILLEIINQLENDGYGLTAVILNASLCGVPQARTRFFLIGELRGKNNALRPILYKKLRKAPMTVREYLGDSLGVEYYYRHPRNYNRRGIYSVDEPSATVRGVNRPVPKGYNTHNADPKGAILSEVRSLTTVERSYLQTFPKDFIFDGTKTHLEQMIGNAVPVKLAQFVAECLLEKKNNEIDCEQLSYFPNQQKKVIIPQRSLGKEM